MDGEDAAFEQRTIATLDHRGHQRAKAVDVEGLPGVCGTDRFEVRLVETCAQEIVQVRGESLVATGKTVMVSYDYEKGASMPLPAATRGLLSRLKGSAPGQTRV